jgi:hypothetical protein
MVLKRQAAERKDDLDRRHGCSEASHSEQWYGLPHIALVTCPRVNLTERDEQPLTGTPKICLFHADHSRGVHTILSVVPAQVFIRQAQRDQGILFEAVLTRSCYDNPPERSFKNAL